MYRVFVFSVVVLLLNGCATSPLKTIDNSTAQSLLGKSRAHILQCAGKPSDQTSHGEGLILRYYKEAPMLEVSSPTSKGSQPGIHHGCWASLLIEHDQVTGIEFLTVPEGAEKEDDECEAIFQGCSP